MEVNYQPTKLNEKVITIVSNILYAVTIVYLFAIVIINYINFGELVIPFLPFAINLIAGFIDTCIRNYLFLKSGQGKKDRILVVGTIFLCIMILIYTYTETNQSILFWCTYLVYQSIEGIYSKFFNK